MINCPYCAQEVSSCPYCGANLETPAAPISPSPGFLRGPLFHGSLKTRVALLAGLLLVLMVSQTLLASFMMMRSRNGLEELEKQVVSFRESADAENLQGEAGRFSEMEKMTAELMIMGRTGQLMILMTAAIDILLAVLVTTLFVKALTREEESQPSKSRLS